MPAHWTLGYCTNIHAGVDCDAICHNLETISAEVRRRRNSGPADGTKPGVTGKTNPPAESPLGIGLWIPAKASEEMRRTSTRPLATTMRRHGLLPFTINGFPYDNFHQKRVKHAVYQPTWWDDRRLSYTRDLAKILAELLPPDEPLGTISTLPLGWPRQPLDPSNPPTTASDGQPDSADRPVSEEERLHAGTNLRRLAEDLRRLEDRTGKRIVVAIEPEPGCLLETSTQLIQWFDQQLPDPTHRRYLGVCHDVCHAAVMNESQEEVLKRYAAAGILIGKVQISSAVVADWQSIAVSDHHAVLDQLGQFAEDRYLHQTGCIDADGRFRLAEDLPELLATTRTAATEKVIDRKWVTHFHVPVFLERFGLLTTTRQDVLDALAALVRLTDDGKAASQESTDSRDTALPTAGLEFTGHLEIETYAWSVLPTAMRRHDLAGDIAEELDWVATQLSHLPLTSDTGLTA